MQHTTLFTGCSTTLFTGCSATLFTGCSTTLFTGCNTTLFTGCNTTLFTGCNTTFPFHRVQHIVHACWQVKNLQQVMLLQVFLRMYLFTFSKESEKVEEKLGEFVYINPTFVHFILRTRLGIWIWFKGLFYDYQLWLSFVYLLSFLSQAKKTCWVCTWTCI